MALSKLDCPSCGAPIELKEGQILTKCPYCNSEITSDTTKLEVTKINNIDLMTADIDKLHELEKQIKDAKDYRIRHNAQKLLMESLGDSYEEFIHNKQVEIQSNNKSLTYIIHTNGQIEELKDGEVTKKGQLYRNGYPAQDALVTVIHYIKYNVTGLQNLWGCGNIKMQGGELDGS